MNNRRRAEDVTLAVCLVALAALIFAPTCARAQVTLNFLHTFAALSSASPGTNADGVTSTSGLLRGSDGLFYGTTAAGSAHGYGTVFKVAADGSGFAVIHAFSAPNSDGLNSDGAVPLSGLVEGSDGYLYGTASVAGANNSGALFRLAKDGSGFSVIHHFSRADSAGHNSDGGGPTGALLFSTDAFLYGTTLSGGTFGNGVVLGIAQDDSSGKIVHNFSALDANGDNTDGKNPYGLLVQGGDGYLYGTTQFGGAKGVGTVFRVRPDGTVFQTLHSFSALDQNNANADGAGPIAGLTAGTDGFFYGITESGGTGATGTIFKLHPDGTNFTVIHTFSPVDNYNRNSDGAQPYAGLTVGTDGFLYGTTESGGLNGFGAVYKLHSNGSGLTVIHSFGASGSGDSASPYAALTAAQGFFYGTTEGGMMDTGAVFRVKADGSGYQVLHAFSADTPNGVSPVGALTLGGDGALHGTTYGGGAGDGLVFRVSLVQTHILWNNTNGQISLWTVGDDGLFTSHSYGPFAGWTAKAISSGPEGVTHILWTHSPDGQLSLWNVALNDTYTSRSYGPFAGWSAVSVSDGPDGRTHLLWNKTDGTASVWNLNAVTGTFTSAAFGPFAGWKATAVATGGDDFTDLLWVYTNSQVSGWRLSLSSDGYHQSLYGPYAGYHAQALAVGPDGAEHPLWDKAGGTAALWNADFGTTAFTSSTYGPFSGWTAMGDATGSDGMTHVLWDNTNGQMSLWDVAPGSGGFLSHTYGPYSGWTAVAISAGL